MYDRQKRSVSMMVVALGLGIPQGVWAATEAAFEKVRVRFEQNATDHGGATAPAASPAVVVAAAAGADAKPMSDEEATRIALEKVQGKVLKVEQERKFGKHVKVVAIQSTDGKEVEVIIDLATGEVLAVEDQ